MRLIDNYLPEEEILRAYLGPFKDQFEEHMIFAYSPTVDARVLVTIFNKQINKNFRFKVCYTRTKKAVRLVLKRFEGQIGDQEYWLYDKDWLFPIEDPKGPIKFRIALAGLLDSSSRNFLDENLGGNHNHENPTSS